MKNLSDPSIAKAEDAPCSSQLRIDRELLQELYDKGSSDVKEALRTKYPGLFGPIKTERIDRGYGFYSEYQLADITMTDGGRYQLLIGFGLAPAGFEHKCLVLTGDETLKFELLSDKVVTIVQI